MGTSVEIHVDPCDDALLDHAERRIRDLEGRWSRFVDSSELSQLNRAGGRPTIVSPETTRLFATAWDGHLRTGGLFDPRILAALEGAGYDRSHETLEVDRGPLSTHSPSGLADRGEFGTALEVDIDEAINAVTLPAGERWDPGGIGKGLAADLVVEELFALGATSALVNLGGDMRVHGPAFGEPCWTVQVDDPVAGGVLADIHLTEGGVATSSRSRRRWRHEGEAMHHLIDPRTGHPADTSLVSVTVVASSAWWAEVLAKSALIAGPEDGAKLIRRAGCSAVLIDTSHDVVSIGGHVHLSDAA